MEKTDKLTAEEKWDLLTMFAGSVVMIFVVWAYIVLMWVAFG